MIYDPICASGSWLILALATLEDAAPGEGGEAK